MQVEQVFGFFFETLRRLVAARITSVGLTYWLDVNTPNAPEHTDRARLSTLFPSNSDKPFSFSTQIEVDPLAYGYKSTVRATYFRSHGGGVMVTFAWRKYCMYLVNSDILPIELPSLSNCARCRFVSWDERNPLRACI